MKRLWDVLLGIDLSLVALYALSSLVQAIQGWGEPVVLGADLPRLLWLNAVLLTVTLGAVPLAWAIGTRGWQGALDHFHLRRPWDALWGVLLGFALVLALALVAVALQAVWPASTENPVAEELVQSLDWPLAFALAASAAVGEEIFFRGFLQRYVGLWGQAALFGLLHLSYGTVLQVVAPVALGILWGYLIKRGRSLWLCIAAHFVFDFTQFAAVLWTQA